MTSSWISILSFEIVIRIYSLPFVCVFVEPTREILTFLDFLIQDKFLLNLILNENGSKKASIDARGERRLRHVKKCLQSSSTKIWEGSGILICKRWRSLMWFSFSMSLSINIISRMKFTSCLFFTSSTTTTSTLQKIAFFLPSFSS